MTLQTQSIEQLRGRTEYFAPTKWRQATKVVDGFVTDREFAHRLHARGLDLANTTTPAYADTLSLYGEDYCVVNQLEGLLDQTEADQIRLLANAPLFLHNQAELAFCEQERKTRRLTQEEWNYYQNLKPYTVWYNRILADYAYSNPDDTLSHLNNALIQQSTEMLADSENINRTVAMATRGARTEAVTRHLFDLAGVNYTPGTLEEDLRGGDFIVIYKGRRVKVDIKSSLHKIAELRGGYEKINKEYIDYAIKKLDSNHGRKKQFVVVLYCGFTDADLGDSLGMSLAPEETQQHAISLAAQLHRALKELWP